jgi:hypothetical protein
MCPFIYCPKTNKPIELLNVCFVLKYLKKNKSPQTIGLTKIVYKKKNPVFNDGVTFYYFFYFILFFLEFSFRVEKEDVEPSLLVQLMDSGFVHLFLFYFIYFLF